MTAPPPTAGLFCRACKLPLDKRAASYADPKNPLCSACLRRTVGTSIKVGIPTHPATKALIDEDIEARLACQDAEDAEYAADVRARAAEERQRRRDEEGRSRWPFRAPDDSTPTEET